MYVFLKNNQISFLNLNLLMMNEFLLNFSYFHLISLKVLYDVLNTLIDLVIKLADHFQLAQCANLIIIFNIAATILGNLFFIYFCLKLIMIDLSINFSQTWNIQIQ